MAKTIGYSSEVITGQIVEAPHVSQSIEAFSAANQQSADIQELTPPPIKTQFEFFWIKLLLPEAIAENDPDTSLLPKFNGIILLSLDPVL